MSLSTDADVYHLRQQLEATNAECERLRTALQYIVSALDDNELSWGVINMARAALDVEQSKQQEVTCAAPTDLMGHTPR